MSAARPDARRSFSAPMESSSRPSRGPSRRGPAPSEGEGPGAGGDEQGGGEQDGAEEEGQGGAVGQQEGPQPGRQGGGDPAADWRGALPATSRAGRRWAGAAGSSRTRRSRAASHREAVPVQDGDEQLGGGEDERGEDDYAQPLPGRDEERADEEGAGRDLEGPHHGRRHRGGFAGQAKLISVCSGTGRRTGSPEPKSTSIAIQARRPLETGVSPTRRPSSRDGSLTITHGDSGGDDSESNGA